MENIDLKVNDRKLRLFVGRVGYTIQPTLFAISRHVIVPETVLGAVAKASGLTVADLVGRRNERVVNIPRQIAFLLIRNIFPEMSYPNIGKMFDRNHSSVMHGVRKARDELASLPNPIFHEACNMLGVEPVLREKLEEEAEFHRRRTISKPRGAQAQTRSCLKCRKPFKSNGPGHRLCKRESCRSARKDLLHDKYMVV